MVVSTTGAPVVAALINGLATVLAVVIAAVLAVWRIRAGRTYDRRIRNLETLQDRTAELAKAIRGYGASVRARTESALAIAPTSTDTDNLIDSQISEQAKEEHSNSLDLLVVAASRVEETIIVELNEHWRRISWRRSVDSKDVTASEEQTAREWFDLACAQALTSSTGRLSDPQRQGWRSRLDAVVDDSNDTDPTA